MKTFKRSNNRSLKGWVRWLPAWLYLWIIKRYCERMSIDKSQCDWAFDGDVLVAVEDEVEIMGGSRD